MPRAAPGPLTRLADRIVLRTVLYYATVLVIGWLAHRSWPQLLASADARPMLGFPGATPDQAAPATVVGASRPLLVTRAMVAALLLAIPVAWIYTLTRARRGYQQSVVQLLVLLPMVVAGIVGLVKESLPLAFALAGIVAAVRFRNTLDDSKDAVYVFLATGLGLAAAVDVPVAVVASVLFNAVMLVLWYTDFGNAPPRLSSAMRERRLERVRDSMTETGTFVARVDEALLREMTAEQLNALSARAARRAREQALDPPLPVLERREGRLRVRTFDGERSRQQVEPLLGAYAKRWEYGGTFSDVDGTQIVEYAVTLKRSTVPDDLLRGIRDVGAPEVIGAELH